MAFELKEQPLKLRDIPTQDATDSEVLAFALSFNGYEHCGSLEACAQLANSGNLQSINDYRAALFFEQRRLHFGANAFALPSDESDAVDELALMRQYIQAIRALVSANGTTESLSSTED